MKKQINEKKSIWKQWKIIVAYCIIGLLILLMIIIVESESIEPEPVKYLEFSIKPIGNINTVRVIENKRPEHNTNNIYFFISVP